MHSKINKKHETIMCLCIISEVHYSSDHGEIMMFDGCNSKNMPGQFTTTHILKVVVVIYINTVDLS